MIPSHLRRRRPALRQCRHSRHQLPRSHLQRHLRRLRLALSDDQGPRLRSRWRLQLRSMVQLDLRMLNRSPLRAQRLGRSRTMGWPRRVGRQQRQRRWPWLRPRRLRRSWRIRPLGNQSQRHQLRSLDHLDRWLGSFLLVDGNLVRLLFDHELPSARYRHHHRHLWRLNPSHHRHDLRYPSRRCGCYHHRRQHRQWRPFAPRCGSCRRSPRRHLRHHARLVGIFIPYASFWG